MGGIVPYGYRKVGEKRDAHLVISEDPIPGLAMSEADVIREVFRMAAVERKSCRIIAARLNDLRIPCAYVRDDRLLLRGKRRQRTAGVWRAGRIRGLITNKTYMGIHEFGKRTVSGRPVISRPVPAIVTEEVWQKAQATLKANFLFGIRSSRNQYLLRGLIKCGLCGLTYVGIAANRPNGKREFYYRCNGAHSPSVYSATGAVANPKRCAATTWNSRCGLTSRRSFASPEPVLEQLQARLQSDAQGSDQIRKQVTRLEGLLAQKATERSRVVGLYRRGRLTEADLDAQMDEIGKEETALEAQVAELRGKIAGADSIGATINSAQALLERLRKRLDEPISWELKRRLIEVLVAGVRVDTVEECGVKQSKITVTYRFSQPDQPMPLVLPQSYSTGSVIRIPAAAAHRRRPHSEKTARPEDAPARRRGTTRRVTRRASSTGRRIGPIRKSGTCQPSSSSSATIRCPRRTAWGAQLVRQRTTLGLSQEESAKRLGVDPSTLARWERGEREPAGAFLQRVKSFLQEGKVSDARRAG